MRPQHSPFFSSSGTLPNYSSSLLSQPYADQNIFEYHQASIPIQSTNFTYAPSARSPLLDAADDDKVPVGSWINTTNNPFTPMVNTSPLASSLSLQHAQNHSNFRQTFAPISFSTNTTPTRPANSKTPLSPHPIQNSTSYSQSSTSPLVASHRSLDSQSSSNSNPSTSQSQPSGSIATFPTINGWLLLLPAEFDLVPIDLKDNFSPTPSSKDTPKEKDFSLNPKLFSPVMPLSSALKEAKPRFCELQRGFLFGYGKNRDIAHPKFVVDLKGCTIVSLGRVYANGNNISDEPQFEPRPDSELEPEPDINSYVFAFKIMHPRRKKMLFFSPDNRWGDLDGRAKICTVALMNYKGREIFDEEDAEAIRESREVITHFLDSQLDSLAYQKSKNIEQLVASKQRLKALKSLRKQLLNEYRTLDSSLKNLTIDSDNLSKELSSLEVFENETYKSQSVWVNFFTGLIQKVEESDPNKLSELPSSPIVSNRSFSPVPQSSSISDRSLLSNSFNPRIGPASSVPIRAASPVHRTLSPAPAFQNSLMLSRNLLNELSAQLNEISIHERPLSLPSFHSGVDDTIHESEEERPSDDLPAILQPDSNSVDLSLLSSDPISLFKLVSDRDENRDLSKLFLNLLNKLVRLRSDHTDLTEHLEAAVKRKAELALQDL